MTNQEAYDLALDGIRKQGYKQSLHLSEGSTVMSCAYRGEEGRKCAAGHCIPDHLFDPNMEGQSIGAMLGKYGALEEHFDGVSASLLRELQRAHDAELGGLGAGGPAWEAKMVFLAERFKVNYTPPIPTDDGDEAPPIPLL